MASQSWALDIDLLMTEMNDLPVEIQRNLILLKTLNKKSTEIMRRIDKYADCCFCSKCPKRMKKKKIAKINRLMTQVKDLGDDKVQLSIQTYEMVDKNIRKLDLNLVRLECKRQDQVLVSKPKTQKDLIQSIIRGKKKSMANGEKSSDLDHISTSLAKTSISDSQPILKDKLNPVYGGLRYVGAGKSNHILDMPVDPNEPRFCSCQQVSFGQMIGCDNTECPTEWFHFSCMNLTQTPKGKWFCPQCRTKKKTKKKNRNQEQVFL